jgi:hypothetical protein
MVTVRAGIVMNAVYIVVYMHGYRFHPEAPERITRMWAMLGERGYVKRCKRIPVCGAMW